MSKALVLLLALGLAAATVAPAMAEPTEDAAFAAGSTSLGLLSQIAQVGDDAFSTMDLATALSCGGSPTQHYGPYASSSPDSSTCGNDWAQDTFDRHFTVRKTRRRLSRWSSNSRAAASRPWLGRVRADATRMWAAPSTRASLARCTATW